MMSAKLPPPPSDKAGYPWTTEFPKLPASLPGNRPYPRISIVTPSFRHGKYIEETIRSVLLQGYPNLEYWVIDGGSQDETVEILQKYDAFLSGWISEPDRGQTHAINKGLAKVSGQIIGYLNSDDLLLPGALYTIAKTFAADPSIHLVTGFRKVYDHESRFVTNWFRDRPTNYFMRHYCCVAQETTFWSQALWKELGAFDERFHFAMDYEYWLRAIDRGYRFHLINRYIGGFRDYPQSKTNAQTATYYRDMAVLYHRYDMGDSEAEIHARLGRRWSWRYEVLSNIGTAKWTNHIFLVNLMRRTLEIPYIADLFLAGYRAHKITISDQTDSKMSPLRFIKHYMRAYRRSFAQLLATTSAFGDSAQLLFSSQIANIPSLDSNMAEAEMAANPIPNQIVIGGNWYHLELYSGEIFRWVDNDAEIIIRNPSRRELTLIIEAVIANTTDDTAKLKLQNVSTGEAQIVAAPLKRANLYFQIPASHEDQITLRLSYLGKTAPRGSSGDSRTLNFRVFRLGWNSEIYQLETAFLGNLQRYEAAYPGNRAKSIPFLNTLQRAWRTLRFARQKSQYEYALLKEFQESLNSAKDRLRQISENVPRFSNPDEGYVK